MGKDWRDEYWRECVAIGAEECGAKLTAEQIDCIAGSVQGGHENYGMASGDDVASSNRYADLESALERERDAVRKERNKVLCSACKGRGRIYSAGPYHGSDSECWKCRGDGRHDP